MKILPLLTSVALLALPLTVKAEVSPIRLRIEQKSEVSGKKTDRTQSRSLKIFLTNSSQAAITGLKVKYSYYVRDLKASAVRVLDDGEETADAKALGVTIVETDAATAKRTIAKKAAPATGERFVGYGVQVFDSTGKLVAEQFDPPSLKQEAGK